MSTNSDNKTKKKKTIREYTLGLNAKTKDFIQSWMFLGPSFLGVSVLCAAAHNCGQIIAAATLFGSSLITSYLPLLLIASVVYGGIVGALLNLCIPRLKPIMKGGRA